GGAGSTGSAGAGQTRWVASEATPAAESVASVTVDDAGNAWLAAAGGGELRLSKIDRGGTVVLERRFAYPRELSTRAISPAPGGGVFLAVPGACFRGCVLPIPQLDLGGGPVGNDGAIVRFDAAGGWLSQFSIASADVPSIASDGRGRVAVLQGAQAKTVVVYDAAGNPLFQAGPFAAPRSLPAFAPDGKLLAAFPDRNFRGGFAARTAAYDASGQERWTCTALSGQVPAVVLAVGNDAFAWLDGNELVLSAVPSCLERFRVDPGVPVTSLLPMRDGGVLAMGWLSTGACATSRLRRFDPHGGLLWSRDLPPGGCPDVRVADGAVAPDGDALAAGIVAGSADLGTGQRDAGSGDAFVVDVSP
ncbi:MAG TPA: hypothetical protein VFP65_13010, partial [Anaeromyxobacteraceae bacterium]|nr:hypothetical protein [Anaeromyxobacteraceae bacterium]